MRQQLTTCDNGVIAHKLRNIKIIAKISRWTFLVGHRKRMVANSQGKILW